MSPVEAIHPAAMVQLTRTELTVASEADHE